MSSASSLAAASEYVLWKLRTHVGMKKASATHQQTAPMNQIMGPAVSAVIGFGIQQATRQITGLASALDRGAARCLSIRVRHAHASTAPSVTVV